MLNTPVNGKIQGLLGVFHVLFKANLIFKNFSRQSCMFKVLFKPEQTLLHTFFSYISIRVENTEDPADLDLQSFQKRIHLGSPGQGLIFCTHSLIQAKSSLIFHFLEYN